MKRPAEIQELHAPGPRSTWVRLIDPPEPFTPIRIPRSEHPKVLRLKVTLLGLRPAVWRRVELPDTATFFDLHCAIQDSMPWADSHLHDFETAYPKTGEQLRIGTPSLLEFDPADRLEWKVPLVEILTAKNRRALYNYDAGDNWEHLVHLEVVTPRVPRLWYPRCTGGARACPPDNSGGVWGYREFLKAMKNPNHPDHDDMVNWLGRKTWDPERFDPHKVRFQDTHQWLEWYAELGGVVRHTTKDLAFDGLLI